MQAVHFCFSSEHGEFVPIPRGLRKVVWNCTGMIGAAELISNAEHHVCDVKAVERVYPVHPDLIEPRCTGVPRCAKAIDQGPAMYVGITLAFVRRSCIEKIVPPQPACQRQPIIKQPDSPPILEGETIWMMI